MDFERLQIGAKGEKIRLKGNLGALNNEVVVYRSVSQPAAARAAL
jgi:hypothetical protein